MILPDVRWKISDDIDNVINRFIYISRTVSTLSILCISRWMLVTQFIAFREMMSYLSYTISFYPSISCNSTKSMWYTLDDDTLTLLNRLHNGGSVLDQNYSHFRHNNTAKSLSWYTVFTTINYSLLHFWVISKVTFFTYKIQIQVSSRPTYAIYVARLRIRR